MASPITFTGLATGIDSESIITQMVDLQRQPITRLENQSVLLELKRESLREVNTQFLSLQNETLNLRLESTFSSRSVSSSDESKVRATANFSAAKTNHRVIVHELAQEAAATSHRYLSQASVLGSNTIGINQVGTSTRANAPGAGRLIGGVVLSDSDTLGSLGLAGDFTLKIDPDAEGTHAAKTITGLDASTTVAELITKINNQTDSIKAQLIYDEAAGGRVIQLSSDYVGLDVSISGAVAETVFGIDPGATVTSSGDTGLGSARAKAAISPADVHAGTVNILSTDGLAGSITGSVDLTAFGTEVLQLTLADLGVTEFSGFEIDPDAAGAAGMVAVKHEDGSLLKATDTVADLIETINLSVPDVTAQLVDGTGGAVYLRITANEGGRDLTVQQIGSTSGILQQVLGTGDTVTTSNATTDSAEVTLVQSFYRRGSLIPESQRVVSGTKENFRTVGVSDLIDGVTLIGATSGDVFTPGTARLQINNSERLAIENSERFQLFGVYGVTASSYSTGLGLDTDGSGVIGLNKSVAELNAASAFALDTSGEITAGQFVVGDTILTLTQEEIDEGITLAEIIARINSADEGVAVNYEAASDRFIASASAYGSAGTVSFGTYTGKAGESNVLKVLGLTNIATEILNSAGRDAGLIDQDTELVDAGFSIRPTSGTFTINGTTIEVNAAVDSLTDVIDKINSSAAGITALLDADSKRINLVQNVDEDTIADYIQVGSIYDTSNLIAALRITGGSNADGSVKGAESIKVKNNVGSARREADIEVDGIRYTRNTNTIDDVTPGLSYELLGITESPVTLTVSGDSTKAIEAIARWVTEYNKTIKLLSPERVDSTDRKYLEPLTTEERNTLTYTELLDRFEKFETLNKSEAIRKDSSLQRLINQMQTDVMTPVPDLGGSISSLADIGISSGEPGAPLTTDLQGVLVADSTDYEVIKAALESNQRLLDALNSDDHAVGELFRQQGNSVVSIMGTTAFDEGTPLANAISFQVYNGSNSAFITLEAGEYNKTQLLSLITGQLERNGITDIEVSFDGSGHLKFLNEKTIGSAYIRILDATSQSQTDRLSTRFGIAGGSYTGPVAESKSGVAEKFYTSLHQATGVEGYLRQQVSLGGTYGQGSIYDEMVALQERIQRLEDRISAREERLRKKFANMEKVVARLQEQQSSLSQFLTTSTGSQSG
ncbi:MAG: flagellar filament capping protein FliD [Candidatus Glassbacteria bacterium]|nr:flagellar filament capping protein FliD [Candidatus Glassbacteria bacterium]